MVGLVATSVGGVDDGVDEIEVSITTYQHVTIDSIENVVLAVGVVLAVILWVKAKTKELIVNLLFCGEACIIDIRLHQYSTCFAVAVLSKAYHAIRTRIKVLVMCLDTLKERSKVIVRISEIVKLNDFFMVGREISLILRPTVEEIAELTAVVEPAALFLCPLAKSYQLD